MVGVQVATAAPGAYVTTQSPGADFEATWSAYEQDSGTLLTVLGAGSHEGKPVKRREV